MSRPVRVAILGATGAVGKAMIETLLRRKFPFTTLKLLASARSAGQVVHIQGVPYTVEEATPESFADIDVALFSAGGDISLRFAKEAVARGALVIDNTSAYRMDKSVPLIVPEVNADAFSTHQGIIANPNCSTIQMVVALAPLHRRYHIRRIVVSTYQAASGAGERAIEELRETSRAILDGRAPEPSLLPVAKLKNHYPLGFNVIPQIDVFEENGFTKEEMKMVRETHKILGDESIAVTPTAVRVPVVYGHSEAVYIETELPFVVDDVRTLLRDAKGVTLQDDPTRQEYPQPYFAAGHFDVFVGRIRRDLYAENGLNLWIVSDNILKGAAYNAVQIAELWLRQEGITA
ncbi:aspartate-semialdehyde dehydrogenase [Ferroacidibacillus organovorans]|uniref:Aspartate-semialdehyde dehydrogenase n=1 Tax=Ferroacidibacillus organovorans TaxID=1765683 RepID=A0A117SYI5_9BACL|nr:aspartate-semialdehyde dehydrogenase [Ferroacidibacillus organovorans]KUO96991.1 aspartate-semialdehyde dehydrogenase [Ferroacidibacillus organovorans]